MNAVAELAQDVDGWLQGAALFPGFADMPGIYEPTRVIAFSMLVHAFVVPHDDVTCLLSLPDAEQYRVHCFVRWLPAGAEDARSPVQRQAVLCVHDHVAAARARHRLLLAHHRLPFRHTACKPHSYDPPCIITPCVQETSFLVNSPGIVFVCAYTIGYFWSVLQCLVDESTYYY